MTHELIKSLYKKYPHSEIQDMYKAIYQSVYGCGHLIADVSSAEDYIKKESVCAPSRGDVTENLGEYTRVYLSAVKNGLSAHTLAELLKLSASAELFKLSASADVTEDKNIKDAEMTELLDVLYGMAQNGEVNYDAKEVRGFIDDMAAHHYPPCHHSDSYREEYKPAYRLIKTQYAVFMDAFTLIDKLMNTEESVIIAVDGTSAGGKTTFSRLAEKIYDCNVFHMDDFFLRKEQRTRERYDEPGGNVDRERFLEEVLLPLSRGDSVRYRPFDCGTLTVTDGWDIPKKKLNIVEGAYSMHPSLARYYNASVFVYSSPEIQRERINKRNPNMAENFFDKWIPLENKYFSAFGIKEKCDVVIEND